MRIASTPLLYVDPWSGLSGDMLLAALIDLGVDAGADPLFLEARLAEAVRALGLDDVWIEVETVVERGICARRVGVHDRGETVFRDLARLEACLQEAAPALSRGVAERAATALRRLAGVEGRIHGVAPEKIHFHELGAVDTLVDVVGFFLLLDILGVTEVVHGPVPVGSGRVECAHGNLGVPAPATLELLRGRPVLGGEEEWEVTTPTGALLVTEAAEAWGPLPPMRVHACGYGAGRAALEKAPNVVRLIGGDRVQAGGDLPAGGAAADAILPAAAIPAAAAEAGIRPERDVPAVGVPPGAALGRVVVLETVVDDISPEAIGYVLAGALAAGALDAWCRPVVMKKSRPGFELCVLGRLEDEPALAALVFRETGTLGLRRRVTERFEVPREWVEVEVEGHTVPVKVGRTGMNIISVKAEYEAAAAVARKTGRPISFVMRVATDAARSIITTQAPAKERSRPPTTPECS
jgi:hypothetical protein